MSDNKNVNNKEKGFVVGGYTFKTKQEAQALLQSLRETRADDAETQRLIEPFLK